MSGEKKAKGWRFYGLVGFGAIALLSAGVWALQYAGSGPEKRCRRWWCTTICKSISMSRTSFSTATL
ncbi:hypothetical protein [Escherichia coli]|uniref:hypothetical protein n=1 Tax=Escherichia coli TaxID=562 RepID=UPI00388EB40B